MIPPTAPSRPIEATSTERPSSSSTTIETIVVPNGKSEWATSTPRRSTVAPNVELDHLHTRFQQTAKVFRERAEQAIAGKCIGDGGRGIAKVGHYRVLFAKRRCTPNDRMPKSLPG